MQTHTTGANKICSDKDTIRNHLSEFFDIGLCAIPVKWDEKKKIVSKYPRHEEDAKEGIPTLKDANRWLNSTLSTANGIALKLFPPFGMFDFDLKNTENKNLYNEWLNIISAVNPDALRKVCIETTRSNGYHVYIKYSKLTHKIPVARNKGQEVISVYTGGLLSFCYPSPGYNIIHNSFDDLDELTDDEFELLLSTASLYNEEEDFVRGTSKVKLTEYPVKYESICLRFDYKCTNDVFDNVLNGIGLYPVKDNRLFKNKDFAPYLREGSKATYSAKVYFNDHKRLLLFSASFPGFPTWHDATTAGDKSWSLTPSQIIYYKNKGRWDDTIEEIEAIIESTGLDVIGSEFSEPIELENEVEPAGLRITNVSAFPYEIFPQQIQDYIKPQVIQHDYLAGSILGAVSGAIGNTAVLMAMDGYFIKPILYLAIVAPPGASKSPALSKAFKPLEEYDNSLYRDYEQDLKSHKAALEFAEKGEKPVKPTLPQILIKDSTIEMLLKILSLNRHGCCLYADELSGFLKRMNQYKTGDEVQKWLELWSGSPVMLQRIGREENKVENPFCSIIGGIQPGVLESLSKDENEHNGFFHRFLFVYPEPQEKSNWQIINISDEIKQGYKDFFDTLLSFRGEGKTIYSLDSEANSVYASWFNAKNSKYNRVQNDHLKGIIAKYQDYCLRLALIIQIMEDGALRLEEVTAKSMRGAIKLTEYFFDNMDKAIKILSPESPVDRLNPQHSKFYSALPEAFSTKTALQIGNKMDLKDSAIKMFLTRNVKELFNLIERGKYEKIY